MYPGRCHFVPVDVTSTAQVDEMVARTLDTFGRLDGVFNNAGIGGLSPAEHYSDEAFMRVMDINLMGVVHGILPVYPIMIRQQGGHIINTASIAGVTGYATAAAYTTASVVVHPF